MTISIKWFKAADNIGIAQPQYIIDIFELMTGNDDFALVTSTDTQIVLEGDTRLAGLDTTLELKMTGSGLGFDAAGDLVQGTLNGFTLSQIDSAGTSPLVTLSNWNVAGFLVNEAVALDDGGFGGNDRALDDILYGSGWKYTGSKSVDIFDDTVFTRDGIDFIPNGDDVFKMRGDDDFVDAADGNDVVYGGRGRDKIQGGLGRDEIYGGKGADDLTGDRGYFEGGRDLIKGGDGNDTIYGAAKKDELWGGRGNDRMDGGDGNDVFVFTGKSGHDFLPSFHLDGEETLDIRTKKKITLEFMVLEDELESGPWKGEYFDRGYLVEWGNNSIYVNTYAAADELGLSDYVLV